MRLSKGLRAPCTGARQWAGNLRIGYEASPGDWAAGLVFPATGRLTPDRAWSNASPLALFDKWFEERETQAAESWRIQEARKRFADRTDSGDRCVSAITMARLVRGDPDRMRLV